jgi:hypothetical protein
MERVRHIGLVHKHRVLWGYLLEGLRKSTKKPIRKVDAQAQLRNGHIAKLLGKLIHIIFTIPLPTSHKTKECNIRRKNSSVPYREIIAVCSQIHTKHINIVYGQNEELLNVELAVHIVTTGL